MPLSYQQPVIFRFGLTVPLVARGSMNCMNGPHFSDSECISGSANASDCRSGCTADGRCEIGQGHATGCTGNQCCTGDMVPPYNCTNGVSAFANCLTGDAGVASVGCEDYTCLSITGCSTGS